MDIKSADDRSLNMSRIRSKDTKPEMYLRRLLYSLGYRYRVNYKNVPGSPDLYFISKRVAIFVNGCFWHRHAGCKYAYMPKSNISFWQDKFEKNISRDLSVQSQLQNQEIRCLIIWECTLQKMRRDTKYQDDIIFAIESFIRNADPSYLEL